jgi:hypothetical protein
MSWFDGINEHFSLTFYSNAYESTNVYVNIDGNTADAKATADAYGDDTFTAALTATYTGPYESHSDAASFSATDDPRYHHYY